MGLKLRFEWFDKKTDYLAGKENSKDFDDDGSIIEKLDLEIDKTINQGALEVRDGWIQVIQLYFIHHIDLKNMIILLDFLTEVNDNL
ncbi:colicin E3-like toxin immunity protein [Photorhabdus heterorhabditis]|uniref:colicin E3-like toxin immunity protein n=1 Tax=Photorhabdus heterorhabditis TaxID=880156 RepID=UPI0020B663D8|nr:colicin E3-like toxin immunity protein [Photorhabdus heterorhabditis]